MRNLESGSSNLTHMKIRLSIIIAIASCAPTVLRAQLNPLQAQYYTNRYLGNPAMAGIEKGWALSLSHRSQFSNIPGAPVVQNLTAEYGYKRVGIGLNVTLDRAGLQRYVRALASYAYHLQINEVSTLYFGLSAGIRNQRLAVDEINGNPNDNLVGLYNQRQNYFDGDFGLALTTGKISLEVSLPNLKNLFWNNNGIVADLPVFYSAFSYKIAVNEAELEPKVVFRGIKGFDHIWDAGTQLSFAKKQILLNGFYHSSGSASFGIGMDYQQKYLLGFSHTLQTTSLSNYTNGDFEVNLRLKF